MKELSKEQKLEFINGCMFKVVGAFRDSHFFTCNELSRLLKDFRDCDKVVRIYFPELKKYSSSVDVIRFYEPDQDCPTESNKVRTIIYSFLWLELTGEIKV